MKNVGGGRSPQRTLRPHKGYLKNNPSRLYWSTSPNSFGGQYGVSNNGDLPGDIYRLLGGVVLQPQGKPPKFSGYQASAFILPNGTNNNRIIGPGDEDLPSPDGKPARFFLMLTRLGTVHIRLEMKI